MTTTILSLPGAYAVGTEALSINDLGEVAGFARAPSSSPDGFINVGYIYSNGTYTDVPAPNPASNTGIIVYTINDDGVAVGFDQSTSTGFVYDNNLGASTPVAAVNTPPNTTLISLAINDAGEMAGLTFNASGASLSNAYTLSGGKIPILPTINGALADSSGINSSGEISGSYFYNNNESHGFIFSNNNYTDILFPGSTSTFVLGLNNTGDVVGQYVEGGVPHAFYLDGANYYNIDKLLTSALVSNNIAITPDSFYADDINDSGQIVGNLTYFGTTDQTEHVIAIDTPFDASEAVITPATIACFCQGTRIRTPSGDVLVENLAIGDQVMTLSGVSCAIKWIGTRSYDGRHIRNNHLVMPIRISRGAIEDHTPDKDLMVSPGHGLFIDGTLVPAWRLVNGTNILQIDDRADVQYYHIECEEHELLISNGCPSESFIDAECRNQFQNADEYYRLYPHFVDEARRLPRTEQGFLLHEIWHRLARRAGVSAEGSSIGNLRGFIDILRPGLLEGWAQDQAFPEVPVILEVLESGQSISKVIANQYRDDLRASKIGSGCHAFSVFLPAGLTGETIQVRRIADCAELHLTDDARDYNTRNA